MPSVVIHVDRVDTTTTYVAGVQSHVVTGWHTDGTLGGFAAETANDLAASLCQRAKELDRPVAVVWKDGRYGKQLVTVAIVERAVSAVAEEPEPTARELKVALARVNRVANG